MSDLELSRSSSTNEATKNVDKAATEVTGNGDSTTTNQPASASQSEQSQSQSSNSILSSTSTSSSSSTSDIMDTDDVKDNDEVQQQPNMTPAEDTNSSEIKAQPSDAMNVDNNETTNSSSSTSSTSTAEAETAPVANGDESYASASTTTSTESSQPSYEDEMRDTVLKIHSSKQSQMSLKTLHKTLQSSMKTLSQTATKLRTDNIAIKKYILDVTGGEELLNQVGFHKTTKTENNKTITYLILEASNDTTQQEKLTTAIQLLSDGMENKLTPSASSSAYNTPEKKQQTSADSPSKSSSSAVRTKCPTCSFYGDPLNEGYCSVCYKKRQTGALKSDGPQKCKSGKCDNFGSDKFNGFCSQCHKNEQARLHSWRHRMKIVRLLIKAVFLFNKGKKPVQEDKTRCWICRKKVGITGFECRCNKVFCASHRYQEQHQCPFDYQSEHRKNLRKANEQIVGSKLDKIQ